MACLQQLRLQLITPACYTKMFRLFSTNNETFYVFSRPVCYLLSLSNSLKTFGMDRWVPYFFLKPNFLTSEVCLFVSHCRFSRTHNIEINSVSTSLPSRKKIPFLNHEDKVYMVFCGSCFGLFFMPILLLLLDLRFFRALYSPRFSLANWLTCGQGWRTF